MANLTITDGDLDTGLIRDDGTNWYAAAHYEDGTVVVADTLTELMPHIMPEYST